MSFACAASAAARASACCCASRVCASSAALASIKLAISGGEPLPVSLLQQFQEKFNVTLMEGFGLTETSPIVALNMPWGHKAGSVGKLIPEVKIKTVDDNGNELPVGVDGILRAKQPDMSQNIKKPPVKAPSQPPENGLSKSL